ncbi:unnamed protein product [Haemonchus placei]|uniref:Uncharacterized protein n=1 Tax=Haemonchus placei TaxID=6290 RepID=A0A0N4WU13_HAEPC|nr:unnamed protein product [Haemonchus placei]
MADQFVGPTLFGKKQEPRFDAAVVLLPSEDDDDDGCWLLSEEFWLFVRRQASSLSRPPRTPRSLLNLKIMEFLFNLLKQHA